MLQETFTDRINILFAEYQKETPGRTSEEKFAKMVGMSRQGIHDYLNKKDKLPDGKSLKKLCEKLNVSSDWLLGLSDVRSVDTDLQSACKTLGISEAAAYTLLRQNGESLDHFLSLPEDEWDLIRYHLDNFMTCRKNVLEEDLKDGSSQALPGLSGGHVIMTSVQGADYFARVVGDCVYKALAGDIQESMMKNIL